MSHTPEWGLLHKAKGAARGTVVLCCAEPLLPPVPLDAEEQAVFAQLAYWDKPGRANPTLHDMAKVFPPHHDKYVTFDIDHGGFNNIRLALEETIQVN